MSWNLDHRAGCKSADDCRFNGRNGRLFLVGFLLFPLRLVSTETTGMGGGTAIVREDEGDQGEGASERDQDGTRGAERSGGERALRLLSI